MSADKLTQVGSEGEQVLSAGDQYRVLSMMIGASPADTVRAPITVTRPELQAALAAARMAAQRPPIDLADWGYVPARPPVRRALRPAAKRSRVVRPAAPRRLARARRTRSSSVRRAARRATRTASSSDGPSEPPQDREVVARRGVA